MRIIRLTRERAEEYADAIVSIQNKNHPRGPMTKEEFLGDKIRDGEDLRETPGKWDHSLVVLNKQNEVAAFTLNYERKRETFQDAKVSGDSLYLHIVDVHPDYQNKGIGTGLIKENISRFARRGFAHLRPDKLLVTIQTNQKNARMQHIIEKKIGFRRVGTKYYDEEKTDNVYELEASSSPVENRGRRPGIRNWAMEVRSKGAGRLLSVDPSMARWEGVQLVPGRPRVEIFLAPIEDAVLVIKRIVLHFVSMMKSLWGLLWSLMEKVIKGMASVIKPQTTGLTVIIPSVTYEVAAVVGGGSENAPEPPVGAVVVASSSPLSGSNVFGDATWLDYFEKGLASSSPVKREETMERVKVNMLEAVKAETDLIMISGNPDQYPLLNEVLSSITGEGKVVKTSDDKPLRSPLYRPWPVMGGETTIRSSSAAATHDTMFFKVASPVRIDPSTRPGKMPGLVQDSAHMAAKRMAPWVLPVGLHKSMMPWGGVLQVPERPKVETAIPPVEDGFLRVTVTYLSSRLMNLLDYFGRWLTALFGLWQDIWKKMAGPAGTVTKMTERQKPESAEGGASRTVVQPTKIGSSGGAVVAASSSPVTENSLNDPVWRDYFEKNPEKARRLIEAALAEWDPGALALIREDKDQYPRLNALIDEVESKVALTVPEHDRPPAR